MLDDDDFLSCQESSSDDADGFELLNDWFIVLEVAGKTTGKQRGSRLAAGP